MLISKKVSYGKNNSFKYFIGYNDNDIIKPLNLGLPLAILINLRMKKQK